MRALWLAGLSILAFSAPALSQERGAAPGEDKKALVAALMESLKDRDEKVRIYAASALCYLDYHAVPALIQAVEGKDHSLRADAAKILGSMGTHGRRHQEAIPALTKALKDDDTEVRRWASYALSQIVVSSRP